MGEISQKNVAGGLGATTSFSLFSKQGQKDKAAYSFKTRSYCAPALAYTTGGSLK
jgi:hypothetical protein